MPSQSCSRTQCGICGTERAEAPSPWTRDRQASSLEPTDAQYRRFATKSRVSLASLVVVSQEPETDFLSHIVCKMVVQLFTHGPSLIPSQTLFEYAALLRLEDSAAPGYFPTNNVHKFVETHLVISK